jgi:CBS domain-containing protein
MSEREKHEANREAIARSTVHTGPAAHRYESAFRRYLAAVAYQEHRSAVAAERTAAGEAPRDDGQRGMRADQAVHWDVHDTVVRDVMTRDVVCVPQDASFREIVDALMTHRISAVPVVDANRTVVGIVSESDLLAKVVTGGDPHARVKGSWRTRSVTRRKSQANTASELMTSPAVTTGAQTSVVDAARIAAAELLRRLPVVDDAGRLVGIVTRSDLLSVFDRSDEEIRAHVIDDILRTEFCVDPLSVEVKVDQGVVILSGEVERQAMVGPVSEAVRSTRGVVAVTNNLSYRVPDHRRTEHGGPMY